MEEEQKTGGGVPRAILPAFAALKYLVPVILLVMGSRVMGDYRYLAAGLLELAFVLVLTNWLACRNVVLGWLLNSVLLLLLNLQAAMLFFAASYVTPLMLSNLFNIEDLAGQAQTYISSAVAVVIASLLPVMPVRIPQLDKAAYGIGFAALIELVALLGVGVWAAPLGSALDLKGKWDQYNAFLAQSAAAVSEVGEGAVSPEMIQAYYREEVPGGVDRPDQLPEHPNIIVIFTEGLSQNIVDDERGIMPNVARYQQASLSFTNYYNHTAATYRGINGQLFSGFQLDDHDTNSLIPLHEVLADQGYSTTFINTEPFFGEWTEYLELMGFQDLVGESVTGTYSLTGGSSGDKMSDREAYETLRAVVEEKAQGSQPFFVGIYTFGTHATYDSPDVVFGDGTDAELNKFHNCDYQFGQFMEWFEQSGLAQDTLLVFTADHATYRDLAFLDAFPDYEREHYFLDTMPCFYYYEGVVPGQVDAGGRNTLDFAPTLLDYLDISGPNCFLGESLFLDPNPVEAPGEGLAPMDMVYFDGMGVSTTQDCEIVILDEDELEPYSDEIMDYVTVSRVPL